MYIQDRGFTVIIPSVHTDQILKSTSGAKLKDYLKLI